MPHPWTAVCCLHGAFSYAYIQWFWDRNEKKRIKTHEDMICESYASSLRKSQNRATSVERWAVVHPGPSSTHNFKIPEIEMKGNQGKLTEIWFILPTSPQTHKNAKTCHIHETPRCRLCGPFSYAYIQLFWDRNEKKRIKTHRDMICESSAPSLRKSQNRATSVKRWPVIYAGLSSIHNSEISEIEMKENEWKLTEIWFNPPISPFTNQNGKLHHIYEAPGCQWSRPFFYK